MVDFEFIVVHMGANLECHESVLTLDLFCSSLVAL